MMTATTKMAMLSDPQSLLAEKSVLQACMYPNIQKYLENVWLVDEVCVVMQYIEGLDITKLRQYSDINSSEIATICKGVLCGLEYLHSKSIMHRDVKGANITNNNTGEVYLVDYWLCIIQGVKVHQRSRTFVSC